MIKGKNITLKLENKIILNNVSFDISKGMITTFIGKSGAGKTSLLRCIANLNQHYQGKLFLCGKNIKKLPNVERVKHIGFVSQHFDLFPHMTALKNCIHPMTTALGISYEQAEERAIKTLKDLEIETLKNRYPTKLSGGQKQRVAIARAMCMEPEILLFDEPTSALDPESTRSLQELLKDLSETGISIAVSSHDMLFVKKISNRVYFLENGNIIDFADLRKAPPEHNGQIAKFLALEG